MQVLGRHRHEFRDSSGQPSPALGPRYGHAHLHLTTTSVGAAPSPRVCALRRFLLVQIDYRHDVRRRRFDSNLLKNRKQELRERFILLLGLPDLIDGELTVHTKT